MAKIHLEGSFSLFLCLSLGKMWSKLKAFSYSSFVSITKANEWLRERKLVPALIALKAMTERKTVRTIELRCKHLSGESE